MNSLKTLSLLWHALKEVKVKLCGSELIVSYKSLSLYINEKDVYVKIERDLTVDCNGYLSLQPPEGFNPQEYQDNAEYLYPERDCCGAKSRSNQA